MKIYFAALGGDTVRSMMRLHEKQDEINTLLSYYDLSDMCRIPFRKQTWEMIIQSRRENEN